MILAYMVVLAIACGYLRGGRLSGYAKRPLRLIGCPLLAFIVKAFYSRLASPMGFTPQQLLPWAVCLQYALLIAFCAANMRRKSVWWVLAGTLSNLLVIALNGFRMPVSIIVRQIPRAANTVVSIDSGAVAEYMIADSGARLLPLGDVIYIPFLPASGMASVGDFLLGIGVFLLILDIMLGGDWFKRKGRRKQRFLDV